MPFTEGRARRGKRMQSLRISASSVDWLLSGRQVHWGNVSHGYRSFRARPASSGDPEANERSEDSRRWKSTAFRVTTHVRKPCPLGRGNHIRAGGS
jgi:hypothetical protein